MDEVNFKVDMCRLWITTDSKWLDLEELDQKYRYVSSLRVKLIPVSVTESQKKLRIDDLNFVDEDVFILETKKEGYYVFKQMDKSAYSDKSDEEEKKGITPSASASSFRTTNTNMYTSSSSYSSYNRYGYEENKKEREPEPPAMEVSNVGPFDMADL